MENLTLFSALSGGVLIGIGVALLLLFNGRMAGISGIMNGIFQSPQTEMLWRILFVGGLIIGAVLFYLLAPETLAPRRDYPLPLVAGGGFLVGFGTRMGGGCTSGHGICGIARWSLRSIVATAIFMLSGIVTVFAVRHLLGLAS